jgi:hypothetical protein
VSHETDFVWKGTPVGSLSVAQNAELEIAAEVALHALNWACGFGNDWNDVPIVV